MRIVLLVSCLLIGGMFFLAMGGGIRGDENVSILKSNGGGIGDEFGDPFLASGAGSGELIIDLASGDDAALHGGLGGEFPNPFLSSGGGIGGHMKKVLFADKDGLIWQGAGSDALMGITDGNLRVRFSGAGAQTFRNEGIGW
ncbi:MAG: hypothetical protein ABH863_05895 [Candidatus Micrarchaeota archaeon]